MYKSLYEWMNEWTNKIMKGQTYEWMKKEDLNKSLKVWTNVWMNKIINKQTNKIWTKNYWIIELHYEWTTNE